MNGNQFLELLVKLIDKNDPYKSGHSEKVAKLSELLALNMGLEEDVISVLRIGALLHDIGKVLLPGDLWCIPTVIDEEEREMVQKHPLLGANLLRECSFDQSIIEIVKYHHEWWNGKGYPDNLEKEAIPLLARIVGLAESYISMITYDIYSESLTREEAINQIRELKGKHFDPGIVSAFELVMSE